MKTGLLFARDVLMPCLGVQFSAEGSPEALLATIAVVANGSSS